jgi:site-specific recombinase XerD
MLFSAAVRDYIAYARSEQGLAPRTISVYRVILGAYDKWCDARPIAAGGVSASASRDVEARLSTLVIRDYLHALGEQGLRPRTVRNRICPIRSMAAWLVSQGVLRHNPVTDLTLPRKDAATRHVVSDDDLARLIEAVERQKQGRRLALERAMLYALAFSGVRFTELIDLRVADFSASDGTIYVAHGKGEKSRTLYPPAECVAAISIWLTERAKMGCKHDYLFAFDVGRRMGDVGTRAMLESIKARAGLADAEHIKPHAFRRGMATRMVRRGADILSVGAALGHSQIATTLIYTAHRDRPAERMRDTASLPTPALPVPVSQPALVARPDAPPNPPARRTISAAVHACQEVVVDHLLYVRSAGW